ncbi:hypothetical protein [Leptolyngbya sp. 'hensonii']|nr:hypothetical protein [Leptolyngbya sp. 'hensonii']
MGATVPGSHQQYGPDAVGKVDIHRAWSIATWTGALMDQPDLLHQAFF